MDRRTAGKQVDEVTRILLHSSSTGHAKQDNARLLLHAGMYILGYVWPDGQGEGGPGVGTGLARGEAARQPGWGRRWRRWPSAASWAAVLLWLLLVLTRRIGLNKRRVRVPFPGCHVMCPSLALCMHERMCPRIWIRADRRDPVSRHDRSRYANGAAPMARASDATERAMASGRGGQGIG